jgi:hypothetical protein
MTAHPDKPTLTPVRIEWFARYHLDNPAWGVFHVALDDGNFECGASDLERDSWPNELREAAAWFDRLTRSQRVRLDRKAKERANAIRVAGLYRRQPTTSGRSE